MSQCGWSNCALDIKRQIELLIENLRAQLSQNLIGIYLHGSLSMNCFNPQRSDIDLLVVNRHPMEIETKRRTALFLLENSAQPGPVEISFLRQSDLSPWRYPTSFDFHYSEDWRGDFEMTLASDQWKKGYGLPEVDEDLAAHIMVTNRRGLCLYGAPVSEVLPEVPRRDFICSILADVESPKFGFKAVLQYPVYVVLNSCRTLAFLQSGFILSKYEGGVWALENLPLTFHNLIKGSLNEYCSGSGESPLPKEDLLDFAAFMQREIRRQLHFAEF